MLQLFDENKLGENVIFGPDIVMVPQFHIIGKRNLIPLDNFSDMVPQLGKQFWENERNQIKGAVCPDVYIGLARNINWEEKKLEHTASVQVKELKRIPHGFYGDTFEASMCARFRYIGQHHYYNMDKNVAPMLYNAIIEYAQKKHKKYVLSNHTTYFEMIDTRLYDGTYCQLELYTPVSKK
jgi:AraC family transcriptional regulator